MDESTSQAARPALWHKWMVSAVAALLLAGCGGSGEGSSDALLIDYQQALAARLGVEAPEPRSPANIGAFPERRERLVEIPETRDGMLNVYALRECHITTLVAERNSALGRVAPASQRWLYELELWKRLDACLASDVPERLAEADRERLERLAAIKTEQLPRVSWNSLFDSDEWVRSFSRASSPLAPESLAPPPAQRDALAFLQDLTRHQFRPDRQPEVDRLEGHLQALQARPYTAELLRTLMLAEQRLEEASDLLQVALDRHDGCARTAGVKDAPTAANMAAWLTQLEDAAIRWLQDIDTLLEAQISGPQAVGDYRRRWLSLEAPEAPLPAFQAARERHDTLRERLDRRCR